MSVQRATPAIAVAISLSLALLVAGCTVASGDLRGEARTISDATRIEVSHGIRVEVTTGTGPSLIATAQPEILEVLVTEVIGDTLHISLREPVLAHDAIDVAVSLPTLAGVVASGGSVVQVPILAAGPFAVDASGGSRIRAAGTADAITVSASGGARAELAELIATSAQVDASGGAVVELQASGAVTGSASGGARVTVRGAQDVRVDTSGGATLETE